MISFDVKIKDFRAHKSKTKMNVFELFHSWQGIGPNGITHTEWRTEWQISRSVLRWGFYWGLYVFVELSEFDFGDLWYFLCSDQASTDEDGWNSSYSSELFADQTVLAFRRTLILSHQFIQGLIQLEWQNCTKYLSICGKGRFQFWDGWRKDPNSL